MAESLEDKVKRLVLKAPAIWADTKKAGKAIQLVRKGHISKNPDGTWTVKSQADCKTKYTVCYETQDCTCPNHADSHEICKHWMSIDLTTA